METVQEFYKTVRQAFPSITAKADDLHLKKWEELSNEFAYSWFESLANALNEEMNRGRPYNTHQALFEFMAVALSTAGETVHQCIDVAFVENLFWQVPSTECARYWSEMPHSLRDLYLRFHQREP